MQVSCKYSMLRLCVYTYLSRHNYWFFPPPLSCLILRYDRTLKRLSQFGVVSKTQHSHERTVYVYVWPHCFSHHRILTMVFLSADCSFCICDRVRTIGVINVYYYFNLAAFVFGTVLYCVL